MASQNVLIIGCGIAGPVMAILLKQKGWHPIIFEKAPTPADVGASIMLCPNGLKVLNLLDGGKLIDRFLNNGPALEGLSEYKGTGELLGSSDVPTEFKERFGQPAVGIRRTLLSGWLRELAVEKGIEIRDDWTLERIDEDEDSVTAFFDGGRSETGVFLVGCDGIRSTSRKLLLARSGVDDGRPSFIGLTQTNGFSPTPTPFLGTPSVRNWYGENMHFICYPITHNRVSWAVTRREEEGSEATWGLFDAKQRVSVKERLRTKMESSGWDPVVLGMIDEAERMIKYGIFDRPELEIEQWFSGRCVLVGDAVHPASLFLGQGANQACEDCYYVSNPIPSFDASKRLSTDELAAIFRAYAEKQQPHTAALTLAARRQGTVRVAPAQACAERDKMVAQMVANKGEWLARFGIAYTRPF